MAWIALSGVGRERAPVNAASANLLSKKDVLARTGPVVSTIWPELQNVQLSPDLILTPSGIRSPRHAHQVLTAAWQILCEDAHGASLGVVTWNAKSGELVSIVLGSNWTRDPLMSGPRMNESEARTMTRHWLRDLTGRATNVSWREVHEKIDPRTVISDWTANGRTAHLAVNLRTGGLLVLRMARERTPERQAAVASAEAVRTR